MRIFTHKPPGSARRVRALYAGTAALGQLSRVRSRIAGGS